MHGRIHEVNQTTLDETIDKAIATIIVTDESVLIDLRKVSVIDLPLIYFRIASTYMDVFDKLAMEEFKESN